MKNTKVIFLMVAVVGFLFYSCNKEEETPLDNTLASSVIGTYTGTLKSTATNQSSPATLNVTLINDSLVSMHCLSYNFDSTFTMQLYQNYDSIMVCHTGQEFYNEYGHNRNNYDFCTNRQSGWENNAWMNDGNCWGNMNQGWGNSNWAGTDQWNAWTNHMNTQHNQNDNHFGGFNPNMNSCIYKFSIENSSNYLKVFEGVK
ncbi:hypothetical protein [Sunxiuqinia rutila]|uniref:hypothetical protein n=1 Tax=Sunxiuqinia rutila TaxID=1397841 RepID=UPI003D363259